MLRRATTKRTKAPPPAREGAADWTFLTNHAHVLLCIAADPLARLRDLAERVGITERAVQRIVADLEAAGYLEHEREGRRNVYRVRAQMPLRHPVERHRKVAVLLEPVHASARPAAR
jgi:DNA-binding IclR family transcriptional regulator